MAVTRESIILEAGVWTDLYAATGITVGTKIVVQNIGSSDVYLSSSLTQPAKNSDSWQRLQYNDFPMTNNEGDLGVWAFCQNQGAKINVWIVGEDTGWTPYIETNTLGRTVDERKSEFDKFAFTQTLLSILSDIQIRLDLLNARIEEAFETRIGRKDVENDYSGL